MLVGQKGSRKNADYLAPRKSGGASKDGFHPKSAFLTRNQIAETSCFRSIDRLICIAKVAMHAHSAPFSDRVRPAAESI
jgi:hypothetical protein